MSARPAVFVEMAPEVCCSCGVNFSVPSGLQDQRRGDGKIFYCPNGHPQHYSETEAQRLRKRLDQREKDLSEERRRRFDAEAAAGQERAKRERLQRRVRAGVCPLCKRTFQQLARHMACKHQKGDA